MATSLRHCCAIGNALAARRTFGRCCNRPQAWPVHRSQFSMVTHKRHSSSTSSEAKPDVNDAGSASSGFSFPLQVASVASLATLGGLAWIATRGPETGSKSSVEIDIKPITEEVFDTCDNLFVFWLDKAEDLVERRDDIQRIIRNLVEQKGMHRVRFYHNIPKEGDPPPPEPKDPEGAESEKPSLRIVMYKGQRKTALKIGSEIPTEKVVTFFQPLSEDIAKLKAPKFVPLVTNSTFEEDVLKASAPGKPMVLMQMYEDTCFLCFLMRPFINSLGELLQQNKAPVVIKRLNIEKNDFPDDCPVVRGTPTFCLFRGPQVPGSKWEEFKPKDLSEKISQVFPMLSDEALDRMDELQAMVSRRFQLFTQIVMWTVELQKLEGLVAEAGGAAPSGGQAKEDDDSDFNSVVSQMIAKDMKRLDGIVDNLVHLQNQVDEVEHDAVLVGAMLAEAVMRREKVEEDKISKSRS